MSNKIGITGERTEELTMMTYAVPEKYGVIEKGALNRNLSFLIGKLEHLTSREAREISEHPEELIEMLLEAVNRSVVFGVKFDFTLPDDKRG